MCLYYSCLEEYSLYIERSTSLPLWPYTSEEGKEEMSAGHVSVYCQNLRITAYTLENYSNFKNKFLFNNGSILEINNYFNNRSRGNVRFTEVSEIISTVSNQDFPGLDKFRLLEKKTKCFYWKSVAF